MDFVSATVPRAQPQIIKNIANRKVCSQRTTEGLAFPAPPVSAHNQALLMQRSPWTAYVSSCASSRGIGSELWHAKAFTSGS